MGLLDLDDDASSAKVGTFIRQWQVPDCCFHVDCGGMSVSLVSLRVSLTRLLRSLKPVHLEPVDELRFRVPKSVPVRKAPLTGTAL